VTYKVLLNQDPSVQADMVILLVDASNLKRNLLFCSQIIDLKIPVVVALTMMDLAGQKGIEIDVEGWKGSWVSLSSRQSPQEQRHPPAEKGRRMAGPPAQQCPPAGFHQQPGLAAGAIQDVKQMFPEISDYTAIHYLINHEHFDFTAAVQSGVRK
jgi:ferrous iron transport protein B